MLFSAADEVRSGSAEAVVVALEKDHQDAAGFGVVAESPILDASDPPAAMIICGLSGLLVPSLEC